MKSAEHHSKSVESFSDSQDEVTGLPWLCTWRSIYLFVFGSFILWVLLLLALTVSFS